MTAPTIAERIDAVSALFGTTFTCGLAFLVIVGVAYVSRHERLRRARRDRRPLFVSDLMGPWRDRKPGELP